MENINPTITQHLADLTQQYDSRLLFAAESGSRAWGLPSPDSDYDVRFIYAHATHWYLSIEDRRETIETVFPDNIDLSGFELRKALRMFSICNISLNEQIQSPVVYGGDPKFISRLTTLIPVYFQKKRALFHYLKIAEQAFHQGMQGLSIGINRFFYVVRPLLACEWIEAYGTMPPTEFQKILETDFLPLTLTNEIIDRIRQKAVSVDKEPIKLSKELVYWLTETLNRHQETIQLYPNVTESVSLKPLNELFLDQIMVSSEIQQEDT
ncbi:MAG: nucleotidyltransferase domain-containing protein [Planctomycetaceae bacterium]|jgi:predicted nucleotidyltransferase|nr:nucleotidyltransferase domain-containing protein [Planctomycetaceae bacterium]